MDELYDDALSRFYEPVPWHGFPQHIVETLLELVPSDLCSYGEVDIRGRHAATTSTMSQSVTEATDGMGDIAANLGELETGAATVMSNADVVERASEALSKMAAELGQVVAKL